MVYYPLQIMKFVPLIYSWTMCHEVIMYILKCMASYANFKKYYLDCCKKHAFCYHMNCGDAYLISKIELSRAFKTVLFNEELEDIQLLYKILELTLQVITHPLWIIMDCMHIKKYCCIYLGENELYPVFGKVLELFVIPSNSPQDIKWAFYVQKMEDLYFDSHYCAYCVKFIPSFFTTCLSSLPLFPVLHLHKPNKSSNTFVILKHYFIT